MTSKPTTTTAEIHYDDEKLHSSVEVAGEFSNWSPLALSNSEPSTKYSTTVKDLIPGKNYMYKFIIDGTWMLASDGRPITDDDESNVNHFLVAPALKKEESTAPAVATTTENLTSVPATDISSKPEDTDEEKSTVKKTASDAEEEPEAVASTKPLAKDETPAPSAVAADVKPVDKALPVTETKQPEVSTKPESIKKPEPELAVPVKEAAPLEKAKAIEPIAVAAVPATSVSAVPSSNPTISAAGEETTTPDEALNPTAKTVKPTNPTEPVKPAEPVKPVEQAKPVEDLPKEGLAYALTVTDDAAPASDADPAAAALDASAVAPFTNNVVSELPPVAATTQEATTNDSVSRNSSRSVKSPLSTDTSTGKDADGQSHHTYFNQQEQETKLDTASAAPATTSPTTTTTTAGAAPNTTAAETGSGNGAGHASGGADDHKRSWLSRLFSFIARLFK
ncbi:hypothetical protein D0Z00_000796 [Geotrichum galactomycetum]|uniref:Uncharacterized protein n=1 Tax=Geotrichum galactomycetum TaxID=27317 RepID=A0ACB6V8Q3_9ASCO|nr:hypothetical protein D0Z00_000796 [Geotrichum candidum]